MAVRAPVVGLIGVDGGVTTGLVWGKFSPELRDRAGLWKALARGRGVQAIQIEGADTLEGGIKTVIAINGILADWNIDGLGVPDVRIIIEDFQLRRDLRGGTGRDKLAPVFVAGIICGALGGVGWGRTIRFISPSMSKSKANDERLKYWGRLTGGRHGWVRGQRHSRDAYRLVAVGLDQEVI